MISDIANKFQQITKFDLYSYFTDYADFMNNRYSNIRAYYAGEVEVVNADDMNMLNSLLERSGNLLKLFVTFGPKLSNVGYWELQNYCQDLYDTLTKVSILPKYLRTSKTSRGYKPYIQVNFNVGGLRDFKDIERRVNSNGTTENALILGNDFEEEDYEIDDLRAAKLFLNNQRQVVVKTILEEPVDRKVYGRDIRKKIGFQNNDLAIAEYQDNVEQKVQILCELLEGDIPEIPQLGRRKVIGENVHNYSYPELARDIQSVFLQDDLFEDVEITNIAINQGDLYITLNISTKYQYAIQRIIRI